MKNFDNNESKTFEAKTLEIAYELVTSEFNCSITDLEIEIVQQCSKGFLGFGKKNAIIKVTKKYHSKNDFRKKEPKFRNKNIKIEDVSKKIADSQETHKKKEKIETPIVKHNYKNDPKVEPKEKIFDNFYNEEKHDDKIAKVIVKKDKEQIITEIKEKVNELFSFSCFSINDIRVELYDDETIYMEFSGEDSALLIGKEGYRYKALSYILFNWINESYGMMLRLEVAEFLKNQEDAINNYLGPVIETIYETGTYKTKPLDGILVHIALKRLRDEFPDKYVAVKTNQKGDKYVLVNEYRSSN